MIKKEKIVISLVNQHGVLDGELHVMATPIRQSNKVEFTFIVTPFESETLATELLYRVAKRIVTRLAISRHLDG